MTSSSFTPGELAAFLGILAFLLGIALALKRLLQREPPLHREFATVESVQKLDGDLSRIRGEVHAGFKDLREERSRSTGNLHEKIEEFDRKNETRIAELRCELKDDIRGVHDRVNEVLHAVGRLEGRHE
ncbi:MAG: hypothetical protein PHE83_05815 [Opitutaceae bacterium]|nr:hypothetical protein [Opitutaceae bacterium]